MLCHAKWKSVYILQNFSGHLPRSKGGPFLLLDCFFSLMRQDLKYWCWFGTHMIQSTSNLSFSYFKLLNRRLWVWPLFLAISMFNKKLRSMLGLEMIQWLEGLVLQENPGLIPCTHMVVYKWNPSSRGSNLMPDSAMTLVGTRHTCGT